MKTLCVFTIADRPHFLVGHLLRRFEARVNSATGGSGTFGSEPVSPAVIFLSPFLLFLGLVDVEGDEDSAACSLLLGANAADAASADMADSADCEGKEDDDTATIERDDVEDDIVALDCGNEDCDTVVPDCGCEECDRFVLDCSNEACDRVVPSDRGNEECRCLPALGRLFFFFLTGDEVWAPDFSVRMAVSVPKIVAIMGTFRPVPHLTTVPSGLVKVGPMPV